MKGIYSNCTIFTEFPAAKEFIKTVLGIMKSQCIIPSLKKQQRKILNEEVKKYLEDLENNSPTCITTFDIMYKAISAMIKAKISDDDKTIITKELYNYDILYDTNNNIAHMNKVIYNTSSYSALTVDEYKKEYNVVLELYDKIKEKELEIQPNTPDGKVVAATEKFENDYYRFPIYVADDYKEAHKIRNNLYRIILEKENIHLDKAMKILNDYNVKVFADRYKDNDASCYTKMISAEPKIIRELAKLDCVKGIDKIIK